ncbi:MAG TPA: hypothetical protein DCX79_14490 [Planctomycetaceae bacterium]|nr:hypothetical protein [Planctomycetaceae bacterium]
MNTTRISLLSGVLLRRAGGVFQPGGQSVWRHTGSQPEGILTTWGLTGAGIRKRNHKSTHTAKHH